MIEKDLLKQYEIQYPALLEYGFQKRNDQYILEKQLNSEIYVVFQLTFDDLKIDVFSLETKEKYLPFYVKDGNGVYVNELKNKIEMLLQDIIKNCFQKNDMRNQILWYVAEKYQTIPEYPWEDNPTYFTLKTNKNQKWYGLVMDIPYKTLGFKQEKLVDVINLKNTPEKVQLLLNQKNIFPAYHMNKKHWFTILLNNDINFELLKQLIDESYQLVEK